MHHIVFSKKGKNNNNNVILIGNQNPKIFQKLGELALKKEICLIKNKEPKTYLDTWHDTTIKIEFSKKCGWTFTIDTRIMHDVTTYVLTDMDPQKWIEASNQLQKVDQKQNNKLKI